jgi:transcriptional regulator with XRE-family HTH domain
MALTPEQNQQVAGQIREALASRRISRRRLADEARISISTLEKALAGDRPFSLASLVRLEQVLGVALHSSVTSSPQVASADLGGYARSAVAWLEGEYLTLRPSFDPVGAIHAYCTVIAWASPRHCLEFRESERIDAANAQTGQVSLPAARGKVYLVTTEGGEMRLAILNSPTRNGELSGLLLTVTAGIPGLPVATPIALVPRQAGHRFGRFLRGDAPFAGYQVHLEGARRAVHLHEVPA